MGLVLSPMHSFCGNTEESLEHLFIYCDTSKHFWSSLTEWLNEFGFDVRYSGTPLIRTPKGQAKLSILTGCPY